MKPFKILVSNIPDEETEKAVKIHFQKRKHGGCGEVEKVEFLGGGQAIVTVQSEEVGQSILGRAPHILKSGAQLTVKPYEEQRPIQQNAQSSQEQKHVKANRESKGEQMQGNMARNVVSQEVFLEVKAQIDLRAFVGCDSSYFKMLTDASHKTGAQLQGAGHVTGTFEQVKDFRELLRDMISAQATQSSRSNPAFKSTGKGLKEGLPATGTNAKPGNEKSSSNVNVGEVKATDPATLFSETMAVQPEAIDFLFQCYQREIHGFDVEVVYPLNGAKDRVTLKEVAGKDYRKGKHQFTSLYYEVSGFLQREFYDADPLNLSTEEFNGAVQRCLQAGLRVSYSRITDRKYCFYGEPDAMKRLQEIFASSRPRPTAASRVAHQPLCFEQTLSGGVSLKIVHGDITKERVDAIVNPANGYLKHEGGVAGAIVKAGGWCIQQESHKILHRLHNGYLPVGQALFTKAGTLPCNIIIHAVGPVCKNYPENQVVALLSSAVRNALQLAARRNMKSIAIPAISSGTFGVPVGLCARVLFDTVEEFCRSNAGKTSLKEVRFVNIDAPTVTAFTTEYARRYVPTQSPSATLDRGRGRGSVSNGPPPPGTRSTGGPPVGNAWLQHQVSPQPRRPDHQGAVDSTSGIKSSVSSAGDHTQDAGHDQRESVVQGKIIPQTESNPSQTTKWDPLLNDQKPKLPCENEDFQGTNQTTTPPRNDRPWNVSHCSRLLQEYASSPSKQTACKDETNTAHQDAKADTPLDSTNTDTPTKTGVPKIAASFGTKSSSNMTNTPQNGTDKKHPPSTENTPKPTPKTNTRKHDLNMDTPKPESKIDTPKSRSNTDTPKPEPKTDTPQPESKTDTPKPESKTDRPKRESEVDTPEAASSAEISEPLSTDTSQQVSRADTSQSGSETGTIQQIYKTERQLSGTTSSLALISDAYLTDSEEEEEEEVDKGVEEDVKRKQVMDGLRAERTKPNKEEGSVKVEKENVLEQEKGGNDTVKEGERRGKLEEEETGGVEWEYVLVEKDDAHVKEGESRGKEEKMDQKLDLGKVVQMELEKIFHSKTDTPQPVPNTDLPNSMSKTDMFEPVSKTDSLKPESKAAKLESVSTTDTTEPVPNTYSLIAESKTDASEPMPKTDTLEFVSKTDSPKPESKTDTLESMSRTGTPQPVSKTDTLEFMSREVASEQVPKTDTPKPKYKTDTSEPMPKTDTTQPKSKRDTTEPVPKTDTPKPKSKTDTPKPVSKTDTLESVSGKDTSEAVPKADTPKPESKTDIPQPVPKMDTGEPAKITAVQTNTPMEEREPKEHAEKVKQRDKMLQQVIVEMANEKKDDTEEEWDEDEEFYEASEVLD